MKLAYVRSHHYGEEEWKKRELFDWVCGICNNNNISIKATKRVHEHFRECLTLSGWPGPVKIAVESNATVFSLKSDLLFQIQLGNISRCAYDLLKIQYMYQSGKINAAALVVPTNSAAKQLSTNITDSHRVWNELKIFNRVLTIPLLLLAIE